ncbi:MAG: LuxR C-terminal-related transcriptional regulator [Candidatus Saccharimonadales bacterium]
MSAYTAGFSYKKIAREVGLASATVRNYLSNVYPKLGINDKAQLALQMSQHLSDLNRNS